MKHPASSEKKKIVAAYEANNSIARLSKIFGYHRNSIARWIKEADTQKHPFVRKRQPGSGRPSILSKENAEKILKIISKPASSFGFETDLWNSKRIQTICREKLNIKISRMAIHRTLVKLKLSYKKPEKRYAEASPEKQKIWKKEIVPKIKEIMKTKNAILYFEDEACIQLSPVMGKTWGPIGKTVVQKHTGNKGSISVISAITPSGHLVFNIQEAGKRFCSEDIIHFLKELLKHHPKRHLIVVMDCASCHQSKKVKDFIKKQTRLDVFYLPPRSPEFNPDEKVWWHLKTHSLRSHKAKTIPELKAITKRKMRSLSLNRKKVSSIFKLCKMAHLYL